MTPEKEQAIELVNKFGNFTIQESWQSKNYFAIECALIAVDEMINLVDKLRYYIKYDEDMAYWQEVKQEIEKL